MIRSATVADAQDLLTIYNYYVVNTPISFEEEPVAAADMTGRMEQVLKNLPWLLWEEDGVVRGFAYASAWKGRCAYRHSVESTVYLHPEWLCKGIGSRLYEALLADLRRREIHTVIGGIALPNAASVGLHEKFGFRKIAHFSEVGWKFGKWVDVGYWQLLLQRP